MFKYGKPSLRCAFVWVSCLPVLVVLLAPVRAHAMGLGNSAPIIDALVAEPNTVGSGATTVLTCVAHDVDGSITKYEWSAPAGSFPNGGTVETTDAPTNTIVWTAPTEIGSYALSCKVYDSGGMFGGSATASAIVVIDVAALSLAPVIESFTSDSATLLPGEAVAISCLATDPDNDSISFSWETTGGTISDDMDPDPENVTWTAPAVAGIYVVTVTVTDSSGAAASRTLTFEVRFFEYQTSLLAKCRVPIRVAAADFGEYYVTDRDRVHVFAPDGTWLREFSGLRLPRGIAVSRAGEVFIGEAGTGSIRVFDRWGQVLRTIAPAGACQFPSDICLDGKGLLYVVDSRAHRVRIFNVDGGSVADFGGKGTAPGQFDFPSGIAYDPGNEHILVADQRNYRVQVFDRRGTYLSSFGSEGSGSGGFGYIQGLAVDPKGRVLVADSFLGQVQVLTAAGTWIGSMGSFGTNPGELRLPTDVVVDPTGRVVITSMNNGRLEIFKLLDVTGEYADEPPVLNDADGECSYCGRGRCPPLGRGRCPPPEGESCKSDQKRHPPRWHGPPRWKRPDSCGCRGGQGG